MLLASITHAKDDVSQRMLIEARTGGEQMVYTVERFLQKNGDFLSMQRLPETTQYIKTLKEALTGGDKDAISKAIDAINEFTRPFADG